MSRRILLINGPNINLLGTREKDVYGTMGYDELCKKLIAAAREMKLNLEIFQSNHEGALVDKVQSARREADMIVINPGAYTHTSIALRDALAAVEVPFIEVHISNIYAREPFRHKSFVSDIATGVIAGFGTRGYFFALDAADRILGRNEDLDVRR